MHGLIELEAITRHFGASLFALGALSHRIHIRSAACSLSLSMSFLRSLCCRSSPADGNPGPRRNQHTADGPSEPTEKLPTDQDVSKLPEPPFKFIKYLNDNESVRTLDLLNPYLEYEQSLRREFAKGHKNIHPLANLIPVFEGTESIGIRNGDRKDGNKDKYIMPLGTSELYNEGAPAVVKTLAEYNRQFAAFTHCK